MLRNSLKSLLLAVPSKFASSLSRKASVLQRIVFLGLAMSAVEPAFATEVVEFYNANLDHYFITANASEAAAIDTGSAGPGWSRTSYRFTAGGSTPVCRFYGSVSPGPNSHLYVLQGTECTSLQQLQATTPSTQPRWNFESLDFLSTPPTSGTTCPSGTVPIYRAYNNGSSRNIDSNHRLSSDFAAIQQVVARGWAYEGVTMCAPPPGVVSTCRASVKSGFSGDLNAIYTDRQGGGGGNGEGGSGGAGAGGGEGKILSALVTVTRLSDGVVLGSAVTDNFNGLVTIKPCSADGPLLLTLSGQPGALYYDEAKGQLIPFGTDQVLHALVDYLDENVGVSAITEAAFRYALNNFSPTSGAGGQVLTTGSVTGLSLAQLQSANQAVLTAFNAAMDSGTQLATIKSLPTPIDSSSPSSALPLNRYGIAATVLGGFVKAAGTYQPSSAAPALGSTEQLARDLTDGKLDGLAKDGTAAATGSNTYYSAQQFPAALKSGMTEVAQQFGKTTTATLLTTSPYSGDWLGPMSGDINGSTAFSIDASGNYKNFEENGTKGTGTVSTSGAISFVWSYTDTELTFTFNGNLTLQGTASGTWFTSGVGAPFSGTWQATRKPPN